MRAVFICNALDEDTPAMASQVRWVQALAARPEIEDVRVLTRRLGRASLPDNVTVDVFGRGRGIKRVLCFTSAVRRLPPSSADFFLVCRRGPYPALLLPWKLATGAAVYHWKAHPRSSLPLRLYARWCDDLVFTSTSRSFPLDLPKVKVVGHGIDTDLFRPRAAADDDREVAGDLLMVGRISPVKHVDQAVRIVAECRSRYGVTPTLDVVGPFSAADAEHGRELRSLVDKLGLEASVRFLGEVAYDEMPELMSRYRAVLNLAGTALDKSALEAMALGLPVVTTNACTVEVLPDHMVGELAVSADDLVDQAAKVHEILDWPPAKRADIGAELREVVVQHHSLHSLFGKILHEIRTHMDSRTGAGR